MRLPTIFCNNILMPIRVHKNVLLIYIVFLQHCLCFRFPRRLVSIIHRVWNNVFVCARQYFDLHSTKLGLCRMDDFTHFGNTVHARIAILFNSGRQKIIRGRGVGQTSGSRSRLQVGTRRNTGSRRNIIISIFIT